MIFTKLTYFRPEIAVWIIEQSFRHPGSLEMLFFSPDSTNRVVVPPVSMFFELKKDTS